MDYLMYLNIFVPFGAGSIDADDIRKIVETYEYEAVDYNFLLRR